MASPYNITLELQLRGPANTSQVVGDLRRQLSTAGTVNVDTSRATSNLAATQSALQRVREQAQAASSTFRATAAVTIDASRAMESFGHQAGLALKRFTAFTVAAGTMLQVVRAIREGVSAAIEFDLAMNKVAQVSEEAGNRTGAVREQISSLASGLGVSSQQLAQVAITARQAGFNLRETSDAIRTIALTDLAPSFDSMAQSMEGLIAVSRQFRVESTRFEEAFGGINAVSAAFAVESADIIEAVKKAGGAFSAIAGQTKDPIEALNEFQALFTSVRATTRESAEAIATGLRTIFTRFQRAETVDALRELNVNLRYTREEALALGQVDLEDQFVGPYEAVRRLSEGLRGLRETDPRFASVVEQLGGYRQISRVIPLLKQFEDAERARNVAVAGGISLQSAAEKRQEAFANKLTKTRENYLEVARSIFDSQGFQSTADALLKLANAFAKVVEYATPLLPVLTAIAGVKLFQSAGNLIGGFITGVRPQLPAAQSAVTPVAPKRFASGGVVPGSGWSDSVPAMLTPGEYVIRRDSAQEIGYERLEEMNRQGFAQGGMGRKKYSSRKKYAEGDRVYPPEYQFVEGTEGFTVSGVPSRGPRPSNVPILRYQDGTESSVATSLVGALRQPSVHLRPPGVVTHALHDGPTLGQVVPSLEFHDHGEYPFNSYGPYQVLRTPRSVIRPINAKQFRRELGIRIPALANPLADFDVGPTVDRGAAERNLRRQVTDEAAIDGTTVLQPDAFFTPAQAVAAINGATYTRTGIVDHLGRSLVHRRPSSKSLSHGAFQAAVYEEELVALARLNRAGSTRFIRSLLRDETEQELSDDSRNLLRGFVKSGDTDLGLIAADAVQEQSQPHGELLRKLIEEGRKYGRFNSGGNVKKYFSQYSPYATGGFVFRGIPSLGTKPEGHVGDISLKEFLQGTFDTAGANVAGPLSQTAFNFIRGLRFTNYPFGPSIIDDVGSSTANIVLGGNPGGDASFLTTDVEGLLQNIPLNRAGRLAYRDYPRYVYGLPGSHVGAGRVKSDIAHQALIHSYHSADPIASLLRAYSGGPEKEVLSRSNRAGVAGFIGGLTKRELGSPLADDPKNLLRAFVRTGDHTPGLIAADAIYDQFGETGEDHAELLRKLIKEGSKYGRFATGGEVFRGIPVLGQLNPLLRSRLNHEFDQRMGPFEPGLQAIEATPHTFPSFFVQANRTREASRGRLSVTTELNPPIERDIIRQFVRSFGEPEGPIVYPDKLPVRDTQNLGYAIQDAVSLRFARSRSLRRAAGIETPTRAFGHPDDVLARLSGPARPLLAKGNRASATAFIARLLRQDKGVSLGGDAIGGLRAFHRDNDQTGALAAADWIGEFQSEEHAELLRKLISEGNEYGRFATGGFVYRGIPGYGELDEETQFLADEILTGTVSGRRPLGFEPFFSNITSNRRPRIRLGPQSLANGQRTPFVETYRTFRAGLYLNNPEKVTDEVVRQVTGRKGSFNPATSLMGETGSYQNRRESVLAERLTRLVFGGGDHPLPGTEPAQEALGIYHANYGTGEVRRFQRENPSFRELLGKSNRSYAARYINRLTRLGTGSPLNDSAKGVLNDYVLSGDKYTGLIAADAVHEQSEEHAQLLRKLIEEGHEYGRFAEGGRTGTSGFVIGGVPAYGQKPTGRVPRSQTTEQVYEHNFGELSPLIRGVRFSKRANIGRSGPYSYDTPISGRNQLGFINLAADPFAAPGGDATRAPSRLGYFDAVQASRSEVTRHVRRRALNLRQPFYDREVERLPVDQEEFYDALYRFDRLATSDSGELRADFKFLHQQVGGSKVLDEFRRSNRESAVSYIRHLLRLEKGSPLTDDALILLNQFTKGDPTAGLIAADAIQDESQPHGELFRELIEQGQKYGRFATGGFVPRFQSYLPKGEAFNIERGSSIIANSTGLNPAKLVDYVKELQDLGPHGIMKGDGVANYNLNERLIKLKGPSYDSSSYFHEVGHALDHRLGDALVPFEGGKSGFLTTASQQELWDLGGISKRFFGQIQEASKAHAVETLLAPYIHGGGELNDDIYNYLTAPDEGFAELFAQYVNPVGTSRFARTQTNSQRERLQFFGDEVIPYAREALGHNEFPEAVKNIRKFRGFNQGGPAALRFLSAGITPRANDPYNSQVLPFQRARVPLLPEHAKRIGRRGLGGAGGFESIEEELVRAAEEGRIAPENQNTFFGQAYYRSTKDAQERFANRRGNYALGAFLNRLELSPSHLRLATPGLSTRFEGQVGTSAYYPGAVDGNQNQIILSPNDALTRFQANATTAHEFGHALHAELFGVERLETPGGIEYLLDERAFALPEFGRFQKDYEKFISSNREAAGLGVHDSRVVYRMQPREQFAEFLGSAFSEAIQGAVPSENDFYGISELPNSATHLAAARELVLKGATKLRAGKKFAEGDKVYPPGYSFIEGTSGFLIRGVPARGPRPSTRRLRNQESAAEAAEAVNNFISIGDKQFDPVFQVGSIRFVPRGEGSVFQLTDKYAIRGLRPQQRSGAPLTLAADPFAIPRGVTAEHLSARSGAFSLDDPEAFFDPLHHYIDAINAYANGEVGQLSDGRFGEVREYVTRANPNLALDGISHHAPQARPAYEAAARRFNRRDAARFFRKLHRDELGAELNDDQKILFKQFIGKGALDAGLVAADSIEEQGDKFGPQAELLRKIILEGQQYGRFAEGGRPLLDSYRGIPVLTGGRGLRNTSRYRLDNTFNDLHKGSEPAVARIRVTEGRVPYFNVWEELLLAQQFGHEEDTLLVAGSDAPPSPEELRRHRERQGPYEGNALDAFLAGGAQFNPGEYDTPVGYVSAAANARFETPEFVRARGIAGLIQPGGGTYVPGPAYGIPPGQYGPHRIINPFADHAADPKFGPFLRRRNRAELGRLFHRFGGVESTDNTRDLLEAFAISGDDTPLLIAADEVQERGFDAPAQLLRKFLEEGKQYGRFAEGGPLRGGFEIKDFEGVPLIGPDPSDETTFGLHRALNFKPGLGNYIPYIRTLERPRVLSRSGIRPMEINKNSRIFRRHYDDENTNTRLNNHNGIIEVLADPFTHIADRELPYGSPGHILFHEPELLPATFAFDKVNFRSILGGGKGYTDSLAAIITQPVQDYLKNSTPGGMPLAERGEYGQIAHNFLTSINIPVASALLRRSLPSSVRGDDTLSKLFRASQKNFKEQAPRDQIIDRILELTMDEESVPAQNALRLRQMGRFAEGGETDERTVKANLRFFARSFGKEKYLSKLLPKFASGVVAGPYSPQLPTDDLDLYGFYGYDSGLVGLNTNFGLNLEQLNAVLAHEAFGHGLDKTIGSYVGGTSRKPNTPQMEVAALFHKAYRQIGSFLADKLPSQELFADAAVATLSGRHPEIFQPDFDYRGIALEIAAKAPAGKDAVRAYSSILEAASKVESIPDRQYIPPFGEAKRRFGLLKGENLNQGGLTNRRKSLSYYASGGPSTDTVPAMLTPGEFVFSREAASSIGLPQLERMNKHGARAVQHFARGGLVRGFAEGDPVDPVPPNATPNAAASLSGLARAATAATTALDRIAQLRERAAQQKAVQPEATQSAYTVTDEEVASARAEAEAKKAQQRKEYESKLRLEAEAKELEVATGSPVTSTPTLESIKPGLDVALARASRFSAPGFKPEQAEAFRKTYRETRESGSSVVEARDAARASVKAVTEELAEGIEKVGLDTRTLAEIDREIKEEEKRAKKSQKSTDSTDGSAVESVSTEVFSPRAIGLPISQQRPRGEVYIDPDVADAGVAAPVPSESQLSPQARAFLDAERKKYEQLAATDPAKAASSTLFGVANDTRELESLAQRRGLKDPSLLSGIGEEELESLASRVAEGKLNYEPDKGPGLLRLAIRRKAFKKLNELTGLGKTVTYADAGGENIVGKSGGALSFSALAGEDGASFEPGVASTAEAEAEIRETLEQVRQGNLDAVLPQKTTDGNPYSSYRARLVAGAKTAIPGLKTKGVSDAELTAIVQSHVLEQFKIAGFIPDSFTPKTSEPASDGRTPTPPPSPTDVIAGDGGKLPPPPPPVASGGEDDFPDEEHDLISDDEETGGRSRRRKRRRGTPIPQEVDERTGSDSGKPPSERKRGRKKKTFVVPSAVINLEGKKKKETPEEKYYRLRDEGATHEEAHRKSGLIGREGSEQLPQDISRVEALRRSQSLPSRTSLNDPAAVGSVDPADIGNRLTPDVRFIAPRGEFARVAGTGQPVVKREPYVLGAPSDVTAEDFAIATGDLSAIGLPPSLPLGGSRVGVPPPGGVALGPPTGYQSNIPGVREVYDRLSRKFPQYAGAEDSINGPLLRAGDGGAERGLPGQTGGLDVQLGLSPQEQKDILDKVTSRGKIIKERFVALAAQAKSLEELDEILADANTLLDANDLTAFEAVSVGKAVENQRKIISGEADTEEQARYQKALEEAPPRPFNPPGRAGVRGSDRYYSEIDTSEDYDIIEAGVQKSLSQTRGQATAAADAQTYTERTLAARNQQGQYVFSPLAPGVVNTAAREQYNQRIAKLGGEGKVSDETKQKIISEELITKENQVRRELIAAEERLLRAMGVAESEVGKLAAQNVNEAFAGGRRVAVNADGKLLGTSTTVRQANEQGIEAPGAAQPNRLGRFFQRVTDSVSGVISGASTGFGFRESRLGRFDQKLTDFFQQSDPTGNTKTGLLLSLPYVGSILRSQSGTAEDAAKSDDGTTFTALQTVSGGIEAGTVGATIGSAIPGLGALGTVAGGAAGAIFGMVESFQQAQKDIAQAKIGEALSKFADRLAGLNSALGSLTNLNPTLDLQTVSEASQSLETAQTERKEVARFDAKQFLGLGFSAESYLSSLSRQRRESAGQLPGLQQFLTTQAQQIGQANPEGNTRELFDRLLGRNLDLNRRSFQEIAETRNVSGDTLRKEFEKAILQGQRAARIERAERESGEGQGQATAAFGRLLLSLRSAADGLSRLERESEKLAAAFEGISQPTRISIGVEKLDLLGTNRGDTLESLDVLSRVGGEDAESLRNNAAAFNATTRALYDALPAALNQRGLSGAPFTTEVVNQIRTSTGETPELKTLFATLRANLEKELEADGGITAIRDQLQQDPAKFFDRLLGGAELVRNTAKQSAAALEEQLNLTTQRLNAFERQLQVVGQTLDEQARVRTQGIRIRAQFAAEREGRSGNLIDRIPLAQLNAGIDARQNRLAGLGEASADPVAIGEELRSTRFSADLAEDRLQRIVRASGGNSPAALAAAGELERLKARALDLSQALKNLTDVSERTAAAQEKLSRLRQEEDSRLNLGERYLTAEPEERLRLDRGFLLASQAYGDGSGNLLDLSIPDRKNALESLRAAGGVTLPLPGSPTGTDAANTLIRNSGFDLNAQQKQERDSLQKVVTDAFATANKAFVELSANQKSLSDDFFANLKRTHEEFFSRLAQQLAQSELGKAESARITASSRLSGANDLFDQRKRLQEFGFRDETQVRTSAESLKKYAESIRQQAEFDKVRGLVDQLETKELEILKAGRGPEGVTRISAQELLEKRRELLASSGVPSTLIEPILSRTNKIDSAQLKDATFAETTERIQKLAPDITTSGTFLRSAGLNVDKIFDTAFNPEEFSKLQKAIDTFSKGDNSFDKVDEDLRVFGDALRNATDDIKRLRESGVAPVAPGVGGEVPFRLAAGGDVFRPSGTDTVPAMLTPGEFVVNAASARANRSLLERVNNARGTAYLADGGPVGDPAFNAAKAKYLAELAAMNQEEKKAYLLAKIGTDNPFTIRAREDLTGAIEGPDANLAAFIAAVREDLNKFALETNPGKTITRLAKEEVKGLLANPDVANLSIPADKAKAREEIAYKAAVEKYAGLSKNALFIESTFGGKDGGVSLFAGAEYRTPEQRGQIRALREAQSAYIVGKAKEAVNLDFATFGGPESLFGRGGPDFTKLSANEKAVLEEAAYLSVSSKWRGYERRLEFADKPNDYGVTLKKFLDVNKDKIDPRQAGETRAKIDQFEIWLKEKKERDAQQKARQAIEQNVTSAITDSALGAGTGTQGALTSALLDKELSFQAKLNPYGASALSLVKRGRTPQALQDATTRRLQKEALTGRFFNAAASGRLRGGFGLLRDTLKAQGQADAIDAKFDPARAAGKLAFAGAVDNFNERSRLANFRPGGGTVFDPFRRADPLAGRDLAARDRERQQAYGAASFRNETRDFERYYRPLTKPQGLFNRPTRPLLFASGGPVPGYGSRDSVPALLTPGEFVLNRSAVARAGGESLQRFNDGGPVRPAVGAGTGLDSSELVRALSEFNRASQTLAQSVVQFNGNAQALAESINRMPRQLTGSFTHTVNVNHNGAEALGRLSQEMRAVAVEETKKILRKVFREQLPDANVDVDGGE